MLYRVHLAVGFELTTLVVIVTDCTGSSIKLGYIAILERINNKKNIRDKRADAESISWSFFFQYDTLKQNFKHSYFGLKIDDFNEIVAR